MGIEWNESFILGIDEIDQQHRSIVENFTKLSTAVQEGKGTEVLADLADFLVDYAQLHFATEERFMVEYDYPRIDEQRREHEDFKRDSDELRKRIGEGGVSRELALEQTGRMVRWVINHVRNHDRDMVAYILKCMEVAI